MWSKAHAQVPKCIVKPTFTSWRTKHGSPSPQARFMPSILRERHLRVWKRIDTCIYATESFCCTLETLITLLINHVYVCVCVCVHSIAQSCPTHCDLWTVTCQAPLSMEFSRQEFWNGLPFSFPKDPPDPGSNPCFLCLLHWQADSLPLCHLGINYISL